MELETPYEELTSTNTSSYMLQSTEDQTIQHMDQITFKAKVITDPTFVLKPGTTVMVTSDIAPAPYILDGLYNVEKNNLIKVSIKNTDVRALSLPAGQPITGVTVQILKKEYYE